MGSGYLRLLWPWNKNNEEWIKCKAKEVKALRFDEQLHHDHNGYLVYLCSCRCCYFFYMDLLLWSKVLVSLPWRIKQRLRLCPLACLKHWNMVHHSYELRACLASPYLRNDQFRSGLLYSSWCHDGWRASWYWTDMSILKSQRRTRYGPLHIQWQNWHSNLKCNGIQTLLCWFIWLWKRRSCSLQVPTWCHECKLWRPNLLRSYQ